MNKDNLTSVPMIGVRKYIPQEAIDATVNQIVEKFNPQRIILFGSYAYGDLRPESDIDLLVVMDTDLKESEQAVQICQKIEYHFGLDLLVRTPATIVRRLALGDAFLQEIVDRGKILHERTDG